MDIIVVGKRHNKTRSFSVNALVLTGFCGSLALMAAGFSWLGFHLGSANSELPERVVFAPPVKQWQERLEAQQGEIRSISEKSRQQMDVLTLRLGQIQGHVLRLDALGQRLVDEEFVSGEEFDFDQAAAVGGPESATEERAFSVPELSRMLSELEARLADREQQLRLLDTLMSRRNLEDDRFVAGRPITWGWLSSRYGYRSDPFTGRRTWHDGVDLAGKEGSDIIAVAAGVVTHAGEQYGYGNLVEIDHGDGLVTRYGHARSIEVKLGDVVRKGQVIALMGSTGRSTGPHVHFEVLKNGKSRNPEDYIQRASR
jgi:murein DD-endopeptidase MepM/ murein hydrolase activator NlpD